MSAQKLQLEVSIQSPENEDSGFNADLAVDLGESADLAYHNTAYFDHNEVHYYNSHEHTLSLKNINLSNWRATGNRVSFYADSYKEIYFEREDVNSTFTYTLGDGKIYRAKIGETSKSTTFHHELNNDIFYVADATTHNSIESYYESDFVFDMHNAIGVQTFDARHTTGRNTYYAAAGTEIIGGADTSTFNANPMFEIGDVRFVTQNDADRINIGASLDDISNVSIGTSSYGESIQFTFKNSSTVTVEGNAGLYSLQSASGQSMDFHYDRNSKTFTQQ